MPPGSAMPSSRAATLTPSPKMSLAFDHDIAEIDADAKLDPAVSAARSALRSAMPRWTSTAQRTASTTLRNSTSTPSPVVLTMRPLMLGDLRIEQRRAVRLELDERARLVRSHEPAVADHIGGKDGGEAALDAVLTRDSHGADLQPPYTPSCGAWMDGAAGRSPP